jgi:hypothetical protein
VGFEPRRRVQFTEPGGAAIYQSQRCRRPQQQARVCFSDISRTARPHTPIRYGTARQGPHAKPDSSVACMARSRWGELFKRREGTVRHEWPAYRQICTCICVLARCPLPAHLPASVSCDAPSRWRNKGRPIERSTLLSYARRALYLKPLAAPGTTHAS